MNNRKLIVTHHAPDLDAVTSVWLLKRFDGQDYATAKIAFVDPGDKISLEECEQNFNCQLHEVTHVDTGMGKFDHHQPEKADRQTCAATLVFDHLVSKYPDLADDIALKKIIAHVLVVDHFGEVYWAESGEDRAVFTIHSLIRGHEFTDPHNDDSQLHFGMEALDYAYAAMKQRVKAEEIIKEKGQEFEITAGKCLALSTRNDDTLKLAQLKGYALVLRKDSEGGHVRIKVRPDAKNADGSEFNLDALDKKIKALDSRATWFYHASGKMLLNGSIKHRHQIASSLSLQQIIDLIKELYA